MSTCEATAVSTPVNARVSTPVGTPVHTPVSTPMNTSASTPVRTQRSRAPSPKPPYHLQNGLMGTHTYPMRKCQGLHRAYKCMRKSCPTVFAPT